MPRKIVPLVTGETYHIFNRGVDKRETFVDKVDYFRFHKSLQVFNTQEPTRGMYELQWNQGWLEKQEPLVTIHAYCLLKNHFHLLLTQTTDGGISEFMKRLGAGYTVYFNERHERSGSLFQGNYKRVHSKTNEQLLQLAAYVNLNNKVHARKDYCLSSFEVYSGKRSESFVDTDLVLNQFRSRKHFCKSAEAVVAEIAKRRLIEKEYIKSVCLE